MAPSGYIYPVERDAEPPGAYLISAGAIQPSIYPAVYWSSRRLTVSKSRIRSGGLKIVGLICSERELAAGAAQSEFASNLIEAASERRLQSRLLSPLKRIVVSVGFLVAANRCNCVIIIGEPTHAYLLQAKAAKGKLKKQAEISM